MLGTLKGLKRSREVFYQSKFSVSQYREQRAEQQAFFLLEALLGFRFL